MTNKSGPRTDWQADVRRLALLGAPGSGKTRLCSELQAALAAAPTHQPAWSICDNPPLTQLTAGRSPVLLMGLDLPTERSIAESQQAADGQLRQQLAQAALPYTVIYGTGVARLQNALAAVAALPAVWPCTAAPLPGAPARGNNNRRPWVWVCDSCSDPDCERRLLSALLAKRTG